MSPDELEPITITGEELEQLSRLMIESLKSIEPVKIEPVTLQLEQLDLDQVVHVAWGWTDPIGQIKDWFYDRLKEIATWFSSTVDSIVKPIKDTVSSILNTVSGLASTIIDSVWNKLLSIKDMIVSGVKGYFDWLWNGVQGIGNTISSTLSSIWNYLQNIGNTVAGSVKEFFDWLWNGIKGVANTINDTLGKIMNYLTGIADTVASSVTGSVKGFFDWLWNGIKGIGDTIINSLGKIGESVQSSFKNVSDQLSGGLKWISDSLSGLVSQLTQLADKLSEFTRNVNQLGAMVMGGISSIGNAVSGFIEWVKGFPNAVASAFKSVTDFFDMMRRGFEAFLSNPLEFIKNNIIEPVMAGLEWIINRIWSGIAWLGGVIVGGLKSLGNIIIDILSSAVEFVMGFTNRLITVASTRHSPAPIDIAQDTYMQMMKLFATDPSVAANLVGTMLFAPANVLFKILEPVKIPELSAKSFIQSLLTAYAWTIPFFLFAYTMQLPARGLAYAVRGIGMSIAGLATKVKGKASPAGVGGEVEFELSKAIGATLINMSEEIMKVADKYSEYSWMGLTFAYHSYISRLLTFQLRNALPIELPPVSELNEMYLRARVATVIPDDLGGDFNAVNKVINYYLAVKGYADYMVKWMFYNPDKLYVVVTDRFGNPRKIPLSLVWDLPPASDIARMWVRDVLRPKGASAAELLDNLKKIFEARGYYIDIARLYTLLAFRYPSPDNLLEFYWRGVAGVLWKKDTMEEPDWKELFNIRWSAKAPYELNLNTSKLNEIISTYMKWHDYFPAPWAEDFPTDKDIVVELGTKLPTAADLRWMTRWGIFEHLSKAQIDVMADLEAIFSKIKDLKGSETRADAVVPEISCDVRMLSRFLIARGLNPLMAPLASVAEAHHALTPEMTLLRTGFIESIRRGFIDVNSSEQLMSGLFVITFNTGYIDTRDPSGRSKFVEVVYKKPVYWLPAQRRLMQIRSVLDRYNMLMRETLRTAVLGVRNLAISVSDGKQIVGSIYSNLSKHVLELINRLTGVAWTPGLDEGYLDIWFNYAEKARQIAIKEWIRRYATRVMAWITYRLSYGWVDISDFQNLMNKLVENNWITQEEASFFVTIMDKLSGIVKREMIPTPLTLATMAEYMVIDDKTIDNVLRDHRVPDEYRDLYKNYIKVKSLKSDYKSLIAVAEKALLSNVIDEKTWEKNYLDRALKFGFVQQEIDLLVERIELEEKIEERKAWKPSPLTVISISEYVPDAVKLLDKVRIDPDFKDVIVKYASIKPLYDDVRTVISAYYRAKRYAELYGASINQDIEKAVEKVFADFGVTDKEQGLRDLAVSLEVLVDAWKEWLPTPSMIATLSEYIQLNPSEITKALEKRGLRGYWLEVWLKYINIRPMIDDVRVLVSRYYRALRYSKIYGATIPQDMENAVKELFSRFGITGEEQSIRELAEAFDVLVDTWRESLREWLPTPSTIATLVEYIQLDANEVRKALEERGLKGYWLNVWLQYVQIKPLVDDVKTLISAYYSAKRYAIRVGMPIPKEIDDKVQSYAKAIGVTQDELVIRDLATELQVLADTYREAVRSISSEVIPSLSSLASMSEYIDIPFDYIIKIMQARRVESTYAQLWLQYISARTISGEVNRIVGRFVALYENFSVPDAVVQTVKSMMAIGGWTGRELQLFDYELQLRRLYRTLITLMPTLREFLYDGQYVADYEKLLEDLLNARGIDVVKYKQQVDYYKRLLKNRRLWRHFSWFRTQLMYAYERGVIDDDDVKTALGYFKAIGLIDDDEIDMILAGFKYRKAYYMAYYSIR
ncbi:MAG: hypothetical protein QW212_01235 [Nitrososphaerales archaeon]